MHAVKFTGDDVLVVERPDPERPEGRVRVDVVATGLCGSDVGFASTGLDVTPGHEYAGVTEDGRRVAVQPNVFCGDCADCRSGRSNICPDAMATFAGMVVQDGGLASFTYVEPGQLHELPEGMPTEWGALAEPTAVAWHSVARLTNAPHGPRVIIGGGTIGLIAAVILDERGYDVTVVGRYEHQRVAADRLGVEYVEEYTGPAPAAVLDSAGSQSSMDLAIALLRPGGHLVTLGGAVWTPMINDKVMHKELILTGSVIYTSEDFAASVRFVARHPELYDALVTHHFPLEEAVDAVAVARGRGAQGAIKVMVHP